MSSYAYGSGTISLRPDMDDVSLERVLDLIEETFMEICDVDKTPERVDVIICQGDKFDSKDALEMLSKLNEFSVGGEIELAWSDDDEPFSHWRYRYAAEYQKWVDEGRYSLYEKYSEDENGTPAFNIPAFALVYKKYQGEYTEPKYYTGAEEASRIIRVFTDKDKANARCKELNEQLDKENKGKDYIDGRYAVEPTVLDI